MRGRGDSGYLAPTWKMVASERSHHTPHPPLYMVYKGAMIPQYIERNYFKFHPPF